MIERTFEEWNKKLWWDIGNFGNLTKNDIKCFQSVLGLYKFVGKNKVLYVGRAIEYKNGTTDSGLYKRLCDYISARDGKKKNPTTAEKKLATDCNDIDVYVLPLEKVDETNVACIAAECAKLEILFISKFQPTLNEKSKYPKP